MTNEEPSAAGARTVAALVKGKAPSAFRFVYLFRNICLGRRDGVIQFLDRDDRPRDLVWSGTKAAAWKEFICRGTLSTIGLYPAPGMPAAPPLSMLPQMLRGLAQYA